MYRRTRRKLQVQKRLYRVVQMRNCESVLVRLPRSATSRNAITHLKLLRTVREWEACGLGFEGKLLRSGSRIAIAALPRPAVLLECAGWERGARAYVWLLWRFDFERLEWIEIARANANDWSWSLVLRPIAGMELRGGRPAEPPHVQAIAARIVQAIDNELESIDPAYRPALLSAVEPQIAGRIAAFLT